MARNKYPEVTVEKILEVSQRLFLEKGYDNTTIQDIVDELGGLTKGAIYHHFKSKEEIMDALSEKMFTSNNPFEEVKKRKDLNALEKMRLAIKLNQAGRIDPPGHSPAEKPKDTGKHAGIQPEISLSLLAGADRRRAERRLYPDPVSRGII